ncbi:transcriptional regulatory protein PtsJ [Haploplasma axanthum]|uniref:Transcriptional regulatory protein PtsJ n=1 Tax=Haploplasma axanthum TaxID=29552 RepID=A0A449BD59_HAPAX|nr:transcriptional regulatory protein PtsJ [Haploplasma axanthum]
MPHNVPIKVKVREKETLDSNNKDKTVKSFIFFSFIDTEIKSWYTIIVNTDNTDGTNITEGRNHVKLENNKVDIYIQIKEHYQKLIEIGALTNGEALPSLRKIAFDLGVNPNTVDKAFRLLESEGYIEIFPKKGAFVKQDLKIDKSKKFLELKRILNELKDEYKKEELMKKIDEIVRGLYDWD